MVGRKKDRASKTTAGGVDTDDTEPEREPLTGPMPPAYLGVSLIVTLLCAPMGLIAIVWGLTVRRRWHRGDENGAYAASKNAEMFMYAGWTMFLLAALAAIAYAIVTTITGD